MSRESAERSGRLAESAAALWLVLKGYRIVDRRVRTSQGEIDIVAWRRLPPPHGTLCFIEVKWRPSIEEAAEAIADRQRHRLTRAAQEFLQRRPRFQNATTRFDALLLAPQTWPRHIRDAFHL